MGCKGRSAIRPSYEDTSASVWNSTVRTRRLGDWSRTTSGRRLTDPGRRSWRDRDVEVYAVLANLLPGHRRVMLRKGHVHRSLLQKARHVVSYAHKPAFERRDPDGDDGWSDFGDEELALYAAWAGSPEGRFMGRRFRLGPNRAWLAH